VTARVGASGDLGEEPRLADPGGAQHLDGARGARRQAVEGVVEAPELVLAAYEGVCDRVDASRTISGCCPDVEARDGEEGGAMPNHHPHPASPMRRLKQLLLVLCAAQLMVILDITAVNVALPDMAQGLGIAGADVGWTITAYSLIFGSLLLLGGRAADLVGPRRMFMTGLGLFTFASLAAATSQSADALFVARGAQGLGAAMLSPAALSILMGTFREGKPRAHALAAWGAVGGAGAAVGVLVGGVLTEFVGWQAIFLVNVPVGIALAFAAHRIVPADTAAPRWTGFDLRGAAFATTGLAGIVYALSQAAESGWSSTEVLGTGGAGVALLVAFVLAERSAPQPLLRLDRLADRAVGGGLAMMLAAAAALFGLFLLASLYLQDVLGAGPLETGLAFLPLAVALAAGVHAGSHVMTHAGIRVPMVAGFGIAAAGLVLLSTVDAGGSYLGDVLPGMLIAGLGLGVVLVSVSVSVMTGAGDDETGMLSGLNTTGHEIGGSVGIAAVATIAAGSSGLTAAGIGDGFLALAGLSGLAALTALVVVPAAAVFLPKLRLAPRVAIH
jgi:EmrB/QacA subfamily drug resistance transporter